MRAVPGCGPLFGIEKKSRGFVCAIAELEDTGLELLFVLIPPCMSHDNNKTECE